MSIWETDLSLSLIPPTEKAKPSTAKSYESAHCFTATEPLTILLSVVLSVLTKKALLCCAFVSANLRMVVSRSLRLDA